MPAAPLDPVSDFTHMLSTISINVKSNVRRMLRNLRSPAPEVFRGRLHDVKRRYVL